MTRALSLNHLVVATLGVIGKNCGRFYLKDLDALSIRYEA